MRVCLLVADYTLVMSNTNCWSATGSNRIMYGSMKTVEQCSQWAASNPACGSAFEHDPNNNWCGCGTAGTINSDCMESQYNAGTSNIYSFGGV